MPFPVSSCIGSSHIRNGQLLYVGLMALAAATANPLAAQADLRGSPSLTLSTEMAERVEKLLSEMTLEEKMGLLRGGTEHPDTDQGEVGYLPGVPRLGVPALRMADGPPGILTRIPSHALPGTIALAATWSRQTARSNGVVIGRQARALGIDVALEPYINLDRDLSVGRAYMTFGEDSLLTSEIGAELIGGIQSQGVMAQAKHFIGFDNDGYNVRIDQQALHELYMPPFQAAIDAGVSSIMCSYTRLNGEFACGSKPILQDLLRKEMGFTGFVTSDWGATHSALFVNAGMDMEMPGEFNRETGGAPKPSFFSTQNARPVARKAPPQDVLNALAGTGFPVPTPEEPQKLFINLADFPRDTDGSNVSSKLAEGEITEATLTEAARRVLTQIARFGYLDGRQKHDVTPEDVEGNAPALQRTAEQAAVLLKNEGNILPLPGKNLPKVALIGPGAGQLMAVGNPTQRSTGLLSRAVSPLDALRSLAPGSRIAYAAENDMTGTVIPGALLSHQGEPGLLRDDGVVDAQIDFTSGRGKAFQADASHSWDGELAVAAEGLYHLHLQVAGGRARLFVDGKIVARSSAVAAVTPGIIQHIDMDNGIPTPDGLDNVRSAVSLTQGNHKIRIELEPDSSGNPAQLRLNWVSPAARQANHEAAIVTAKSADTVVLFLWSRDKPEFALPGDQEKLVEEIAQVSKNVIVVLNTAHPIAMPWLSKVKAVMQMWWPGDEGGHATARLLLGQTSPGGRLPVTWAKRIEDYPATDPRFPERTGHGTNGLTVYSEGLSVGYRWFDAQKIEPLYPFGFGLTYSTFGLSSPSLKPKPNGDVEASVMVRNQGSREADAVPQFYLRAPQNTDYRRLFSDRKLVAFERVTIAAGKTKRVRVTIPKRAFEYWSINDGKWKDLSGDRTVSVGWSSRDLPVNVSIARRPPNP